MAAVSGLSSARISSLFLTSCADITAKVRPPRPLPLETIDPNNPPPDYAGPLPVDADTQTE